MTFRLHQAPNTALKYIEGEKTKRSCGTFWAWTCCLPTLGLSICAKNFDHQFRGCRATPLGKIAENHLGALITSLKGIKNDAEQAHQKLQRQQQGRAIIRIGNGENAQPNRQLTEGDIIEWEVNQTWVALDKAKTDELIEGGYYEAVVAAFEDINSNLEGTRGYAETKMTEDKRMSAEISREGNVRQPLLQNQALSAGSGFLNTSVVRPG